MKDREKSLASFMIEYGKTHCNAMGFYMLVD